jgi:FtsH-binding integral membrane protein
VPLSVLLVAAMAVGCFPVLLIGTYLGHGDRTTLAVVTSLILFTVATTAGLLIRKRIPHLGLILAILLVVAMVTPGLERTSIWIPFVIAALVVGFIFFDSQNVRDTFKNPAGAGNLLFVWTAVLFFFVVQIFVRIALTARE